ncbi:MAG TPA: adenosine kinase [Rhodospirillaceae bacterium]|nr:MAG: hypothetical protein A2018_04470 [Alphaproteobacteria bacterium GWF2_58_20]HAU28774.1 adenosine kinase [Rhodospirillaceae bacterium]
MKEVVGIGHAIVDVIAHADDGFLARHALVKGGMMLVDARRISGILKHLVVDGEHSGGSVANTMAGLGHMGHKCLFVGKVGDDPRGRRFARDLAASGVAFGHVRPFRTSKTGTSCIVVTPDAQRTMTTLLGAARRLSARDLLLRDFAHAKVILLESYLLDSPKGIEVFEKAAGFAKNVGAKLALTLSDAGCVARHLDFLKRFVPAQVNILLGNEDEFAVMGGFEGQVPAILAMTMGARGARIRMDGQCEDVPALPVANLCDTTGAGDMFAAGFLAGMLEGKAALECGCVGVMAATEVISKTGARRARALSV